MITCHPRFVVCLTAFLLLGLTGCSTPATSKSDSDNGPQDDGGAGDGGGGHDDDDGGGGGGPGGGGDDGDDGGTGGDGGGDSGTGTGDDGGGTGDDGGDEGTDTGGGAFIQEPDGGVGGGDDDTGDDDGGTDSGATDTTSEEPECDVENETTLYLSPDDSNSMSSPVQVREAVLSAWNSLTSVPIRTWEFFNYYSFDYPAAAAGSLEITTQMYRGENFPAGEYLLQIGVSSPALSNLYRRPMNITLVLDESGSMGGEPIGLLKEACRAIAASLKSGDVISMVTWDTDNAIVLAGHEVSGSNDALLLSKINAIESGGGTDLHGGLVAGYDLAMQFYDSQRINRIVLISDGGANAGVPAWAALARTTTISWTRSRTRARGRRCSLPTQTRPGRCSTTTS
jgi:Ca-activated chloride channel family protein